MSSIRYRYETHEVGDLDIHVRTLRDKQQYSDPDGVAADLGISSAMWPLFGVVWDAGLALARVALDLEIEGRRILEVGCGIGVASLVLARRGADITATDRHPLAGPFMEWNAGLNEVPEIPFVRTSWDDPDDGTLGRFDVILGSDLLYERGHAKSLAGFIGRHAAPTCEVIITDGRRGYAGKFTKQMAALGFSASEREVTAGEDFEGIVREFHREG